MPTKSATHTGARIGTESAALQPTAVEAVVFKLPSHHPTTTAVAHADLLHRLGGRGGETKALKPKPVFRATCRACARPAMRRPPARVGNKAWRKQAAANFAGRGGDDGDLVIDEAPPPASQVLKPRVTPPQSPSKRVYRADETWSTQQI